jgi:8-oxo-dGTP pyrophosphatase MutT (NUDIX family)
MKPVLAAGALLFRKVKGEILFLLLQNARQGAWGFPKGHAEDQETPEDCARREILEETSLDILRFEPHFREVLHYHVPPAVRADGGGDYDKKVVYFLASAPDGNIEVSAEHKDFKWVNPEEANNLLSFEDLRKLLEKASAFLRDRNVTEKNPGDMDLT